MKAPARWTLRRRLAVALAAAGAAVLLTVAAVGALLGQARATQDHVVRDYFEAYQISNDLFLGLVDSETAVRGYAMTGDEDFLLPYRQRMAQDNAAAFERLQESLRAEPEVLSRLETAAATARTWSRGWAAPTVARVSEAGPRVVDAADLARGKALFDQVRSDYAGYLTALSAARQAALDELHRQMNLLAGLVAGATAGAVLIGAGMWWALRRWVTGPVGELGREVRAVSEGELDHPVAVADPPEIAELGADVESMRRRLVAQIWRAEQATAEAEQARAQLDEQAVELRRSNQELEQFAYVASHDLQEPLRKVASFCQMLERRYKGQLDDRADQYIEFAVDGAKRMQRLINDLLAFSRVGRLTTGWTDVALEDALRAALRNLDAALEDTGGQVTWDPLPVVRGEPGLLTQVFQNLVGNAVKFRGAEPPRVHIGVRRDDERWELCCADNGIGIEPQYAERIFVIFQRLHPKDEYTGTGIGLALCRKIIEYHGGHIWLDPHDPPGTTFRWTLPVAEAATDAAAADGPDAAAADGPDGPAAARPAPAPPTGPDRPAALTTPRPGGSSDV